MSIVRFNIRFLEAADEFLQTLDQGASRKIVENIERAKISIDPRFFKKLDDVIWELRTEHKNIQYRVLAFWDKRGPDVALVVATHGFIKKTDKVPGREIDRAHRIRNQYLEETWQKRKK